MTASKYANNTLTPADMAPRKGTLHLVSIEHIGETFRVHAQCECGSMWSYKPSDWKRKDGMSKRRGCNTRKAKRFAIGKKADVWPDSARGYR
jgi:hypothetical protein